MFPASDGVSIGSEEMRMIAVEHEADMLPVVYGKISVAFHRDLSCGGIHIDDGQIAEAFDELHLAAEMGLGIVCGDDSDVLRPDAEFETVGFRIIDREARPHYDCSFARAVASCN